MPGEHCGSGPGPTGGKVVTLIDAIQRLWGGLRTKSIITQHYRGIIGTKYTHYEKLKCKHRNNTLVIIQCTP